MTTDPFAPNPAAGQQPPAAPAPSTPPPTAASAAQPAPASSAPPAKPAMPAVAAKTPKPKKKRSASTVLLGIVSIVLLLGALSALGLYYFDHDRSQQTQNDMQAKIDTLNAQVADLASQLDAAESDAATAKADGQAAQEKLNSCKDAVQKYAAAMSAGGTVTGEQGTQLTVDVVTSCGITFPFPSLP